jgi:predicted metal-dependent peptidase
MGTDMEKLYVNEAWVETLNDDEVLGVLAHETMHIALAHGIRLMGRDHTIWNFACDFAINLVLQETGFTLPKGGLLDDKYKEMSADQIYELLMKQVDKMRKKMGGGKTGDIGKEMLGDAGGMLGDLRPNDAAATRRTKPRSSAASSSVSLRLPTSRAWQASCRARSSAWSARSSTPRCRGRTSCATT